MVLPWSWACRLPGPSCVGERSPLRLRLRHRRRRRRGLCPGALAPAPHSMEGDPRRLPSLTCPSSSLALSSLSLSLALAATDREKEMEGESGSARRSWARGDHERATRSEGERASQGTPRAGSRKQIAPPRRERGPGGGRRGLGRAERSTRVAPFAPLMPFPASPRDPLLPGPAKGGAATGRRILRTYHRNPMRHERAVGQTSGDGAAEAARSQAPLRRSPLPRARTFPLPRSSHDHAQPLPSCRRLRRNPLLRSPSRSLSPSLGARMRRPVDFRS